MKPALLFVTMCVLGGLGGGLGSMVGHGIGRGGLMVGGFVGGLLLVVVGGYVAERVGWIRRSQRLWAILGGAAGFAIACMVALATLSSPVGPILSTLLIGSGALLGTTLGGSAHEEA